MAAALFLMAGVGLLVGAGSVRIADAVLRDDAGYVSGGATSWQSPGYAVRSESVVMDDAAWTSDLPRRLVGTVQVIAEPTGSDGVFVGIARSADVSRYLRGVAHSTAHDAFGDNNPADLRFVDGGSPRVAPTDAGFWAVSAAGSGTRTITWEPEPGAWTLVVMNQEGTTPVSADVTVGAELPVLGTITLVLLVSGLVVTTLAAVGLWLALRTR